ncbi:MAG TPA: hypothetical protein VHK06_08075 [Candidatus Limnocylindria bacterium]|nr:hypothetical protein [Candidatus Limnocylindria bacterium]
MTTRRPARTGVTAAPRSRTRPHSLAPEHLGDARAAGALVLAVIGSALAITALAIIVSALTLPGRYPADSAPPDVASLGILPALGGAGLLALAAALAGTSVATLLGARRVRPLAIALGAVMAVIGVAGSLVLMLSPIPDGVTAAALFALAVTAGAGAFLLARRRV